MEVIGLIALFVAIVSIVIIIIVSVVLSNKISDSNTDEVNNKIKSLDTNLNKLQNDTDENIKGIKETIKKYDNEITEIKNKIENKTESKTENTIENKIESKTENKIDIKVEDILSGENVIGLLNDKERFDKFIQSYDKLLREDINDDGANNYNKIRKILHAMMFNYRGRGGDSYYYDVYGNLVYSSTSKNETKNTQVNRLISENEEYFEKYVSAEDKEKIKEYQAKCEIAFSIDDYVNQIKKGKSIDELFEKCLSNIESFAEVIY